MIEQLGFPRVRLPIVEPTRVSLVVLETSTGQGLASARRPEVSEEEWQEFLKVLAVIDADALSERQPGRGMPADFSAQVAR